MRELLISRRLAASTTGALLGVGLILAGGGSAGDAQATDEPIETTPAVLLAPPVVRPYRYATPAYALFLRTDRPLVPVYSDPFPTIAVRIPALGAQSQSERDGTVSHRSRLGGWCTRLTLHPMKGRHIERHAAPAVLTLTLASAGGLRSTTLGALSTADGRIAATGRVPAVKLGCRPNGGPN